MEEINHFSHEEHPLKLIDNLETVEGIVADVISCDGCREPISISLGGPAYGCIPCNYFLHKTYAQLPSTFTHHFHSFHTLALIHKDFNSFWSCDVCNNKRLLYGFSYKCKPCNFDACIRCVVAAIADEVVVVAIIDEALVKFKHEGHDPQHTLTLQLGPASILCNACQIEETDFLYQCDDCDFWIHKTCAHLPPMIDLHSHHHPLALVYSLPDNFYNYSYFCNFCQKYIRRRDWLYHCANCRLFAHIKCALNSDKFLTPRDGQEYVVEEDANDLLHFPMSDTFIDPLKLRNSKMIAQDGSGSTCNSLELLNSNRIAQDGGGGHLLDILNFKKIAKDGGGSSGNNNNDDNDDTENNDDDDNNDDDVKPLKNVLDALELINSKKIAKDGVGGSGYNNNNDNDGNDNNDDDDDVEQLKNIHDALIGSADYTSWLNTFFNSPMTKKTMSHGEIIVTDNDDNKDDDYDNNETTIMMTMMMK